MHRTPIQQHFHNLKTAGLSTYQAEAVVRSAFADDQKNEAGEFNYRDTADVLLYGSTWTDMPGALAWVPVASVYGEAWDKLSASRRSEA